MRVSNFGVTLDLSGEEAKLLRGLLASVVTYANDMNEDLTSEVFTEREQELAKEAYRMLYTTGE